MEIPTKDAPLEATPTALKSILWAWAGVINSHMSMPALRRLREDAGESPPECGQRNNSSTASLSYIAVLSGIVTPVRTILPQTGARRLLRQYIGLTRRNNTPLSIYRFRRGSPFEKRIFSCPNSGGLSPASSRNRRNAGVLICELMTPAQAHRMLFAVCPRVYAGNMLLGRVV